MGGGGGGGGRNGVINISTFIRCSKDLKKRRLEKLEGLKYVKHKFPIPILEREMQNHIPCVWA